MIWYFGVFFAGVIFGVIIMGLASSKAKTIHVYHDKDGSISVLTDNPRLVVKHHFPETEV